MFILCVLSETFADFAVKKVFVLFFRKLDSLN